MPAEVL